MFLFLSLDSLGKKIQHLISTLGHIWTVFKCIAMKLFFLFPFCNHISVSCPLGGDGGERGGISRHGLRTNPKENLEPDGETVLLGLCQADGGRLLHTCAGLAGRHDAQHCG